MADKQRRKPLTGKQAVSDALATMPRNDDGSVNERDLIGEVARLLDEDKRQRAADAIAAYRQHERTG